MRKWEDIVKDKLGGYESKLPEGSLAAFHARHATAGATNARRFPLIWAIAPAIAAGLAAVLLIRKPTIPESGVQIIPQPEETYSQVDDNLDTATPPEAAPLIAQAARTKIVRPAPETTQPEEIETIVAVEEIRISEEPAIDSRPAVSDIAPFVPQTSADKTTVQVNMSTGGVIAAGGGLLAALATQLAKVDISATPSDSHVPGRNSNDSEDTPSHRMPLIVGLSVRFPVTEKIGITTGLEYSLYTSSFLHPTGGKTQFVHYMGIPVRLDWVFVSGKWFDAYLGAGVKGDLCMGATLDRETIGKDGPAFRLLGAGGIQFNATRSLSLFVEPEISWTFPSERRALSTYSNEHPWMFTVATGVRLNLGK